MFDQLHTHHHATSTSVHVTEKRAPTDESVRLLREMESEAIAKVQAAIRVQDTAFECVVHVMHDLMNNERKVAAIFSLNGKKIRADCSIKESQTPNDAIEKIVSAVADQLAFEILRPAFGRALFDKLN